MCVLNNVSIQKRNKGNNYFIKEGAVFLWYGRTLIIITYTAAIVFYLLKIALSFILYLKCDPPPTSPGPKNTCYNPLGCFPTQRRL